MKGANVNAVTKTGETALLWAARKGHLDIVKMLIEFEAKIDSATDEGYTPLLWATQNKHFDVAKYLIEKGEGPYLVQKHKNVKLLRDRP